MKISTNWINDFVDIKDLDKKEVADLITNAGVNVEQVTSCNLNNLVIGEIESVTPHSDSDHLNVCMVNVGKETLQIVCGASNVRKGLKVIVALCGAILPGNFEIKQRDVRGVSSNGMICALFELGLEEKTTETYNKGIYELPMDAPVGMDPIKYLGLDDTVYELDLNPNRNDCLSHLGFAYEVGTVLSLPVKKPTFEINCLKDSIKNHFSLDIATENCKLFLSRMVTGVKVKESPNFIKQRLEAAGMRSINNVVDISNYVMLLYGQPLHFYDKDKLGDNITVRMATNNEEVVTLDNQKRVLNDTDIVVTNKKEVVSIAGVMGCLNTEVESSTTNILVESAIFNPYNLRYTSIRLGLRSEASLRSEKQLNYEYTYEAINYACYLLEKYADGKVLEDIVNYDVIDKKDKICTVSIDKINRVLGIKVPKEDIDKILQRLGFSYQFENDIYTVTIPNRRMDVSSLCEDLIEEIGRIYGYDKLENTLPVEPIKVGSYKKTTKFRKDTSKEMRKLGLNEVKTYTLVSCEESKMLSDEDAISLLLPMSNDKAYVRQSLIPSLLKVYDYNKAHGVEDINIYEISNIYHNDEQYSEETLLSVLMSGKYLANSWLNNSVNADFYLLKGLLMQYLNYMGYSDRVSLEVKTPKYDILHPYVYADVLVDKERIGFISKINPKNYNEVYVMELSLTVLMKKKSKRLKYEEVSKYPDIVKDVAFVVAKEITCEDILKVIKMNGGKLLKDVKVFDLYEGEHVESGKKSIAYSLTFNSVERTLLDSEIDVLFRNIIEKVKNKFDAEIRDR